MYPDEPDLLSVKNLSVSFTVDRGVAYAVRNLSFNIAHRHSLGIVGESGCGKSVTSLAIMRLIPEPPGKIESGRIRFNGKELLSLPENRMRLV
ncbi:MAG: ATP-binding cassette domain-containing protein, partial [Chitinivibrionales bacterium]|nr:ATP-binding cassette domain-containing protein [Chitinivibrionales bacterium]